jgi:hypothetical protein
MTGRIGYFSTDTEAKTTLLKAAWAENISAKNIALALMEKFGGTVTKNAVVSKVARLGLPMHSAGVKHGTTRKRA